MKKNLIVVIALIFLIGCAQNKISFEGKVFQHQTDAGNQIVGFDNENIYFKWDDDLGLESFNSTYTIEQLNDSTYRINLDTPIPYLESEYWDVVAKDGNSFYSVESGKLYVIKR